MCHLLLSCGEPRGPLLAFVQRSLLTSRDDQACVPARRTPACGWTDSIDVNTGTLQDPGDDRVRIPHLAGVELIASPHWCRHFGDKREDAARERRVGAQA